MIQAPPDDQRWQAVCERDNAWDDAFVFAVRTTGVYCRPSCPSRRANRENVSFFGTPAQAESAGYRACKRCKPEQGVYSPHTEALIKACRNIQLSEEEPDLATLADLAGLSPSHFQRVFKSQVGLSPKRYAMAIRKQRLRKELPISNDVTSAIFDAGYASASRAYADNAALGISLRKYQTGAEGETIRYASTKTSLGDIIVAASNRGVCMVEFVEKGSSLALLEKYFPRSQLQEADEELKAWMAEIVSRIDLPNKIRPGHQPVPLDIQGTAFQEKVWQALTQIPVGETISYSLLAQAIGKPKATRAVANACASNHMAVLIPCHRVIRGTGEFSGYKWGEERKRILLEREAKDLKGFSRLDD